MSAEAHLPAAQPVKFGLLLIGNFLSGGGGFHCFGEDLAAHLAGAGWPIVMASQKRRKLTRLLDMLWTVWRRRDDYRAAYVEVYSGLAFCWAEMVCWLLRRCGKPYILMLHGGNLPVFAGRWPQRVQRLFAAAKLVAAPSRYLHEQMKPYRPDLLLLPSAFDLKAYVYQERQCPQPNLIWLRSFHHIYNPALAPQVLHRLRATFPQIHLTMYGPDKGDGSLQEMQQVIAELQVQTHISLPGAVTKPEVPQRLNRGDIFLNTTNVDNTPMSVIEAMACGLCIVCTNVGGLPYLLEHEHDALLVPPNDAEAMAAAVHRILTEPQLSETLSRNARQKVEQWCWSKLLPRWEELFRSITKNRQSNIALTSAPIQPPL
ncbi:MAG: glycosyltransferase family 4 protein [Acidobacteria bacterium]|nr:glycosyltransferase family 4 protein [Acidobacteriota bacterium]MBI3425549.1 glycosyltransferase family 4 protein [Acidobacteriota bacterium]